MKNLSNPLPISSNMKSKMIFFFATFLIATSVFSQTPPSLPKWQTGKIYLKLKSSYATRITDYPTIQNDSAGKLLNVMQTYSTTTVETPFNLLDTTNFKKVYRVTFSDTAHIDSFIVKLSRLTCVQYAEKVPAMYTHNTPNDPNIPYHLGLVNANAASTIHISNGNAVVAIVDDAVVSTHEDLSANMSTTNRDVADLDNNADPPYTPSMYPQYSLFTHGTRVAGVAGGVTNNSTGLASVGWNNKIMAVKCQKDNNGNPGQITHGYDGIAWAAANGAHVINCSWGGGYSQTEYNVVVAAKANNIVIVASAGNDFNTNANYPAAYGEGMTGQSWEVISKTLVVAVAALDANSDISNWGTNGFGMPSGSSFGTWVDISAYGTGIYSTYVSVYSSGGNIYPFNNIYQNADGTSMAAPIVAGIAGVMRSYDMTKTADQIINCLLYTANPDIYNSGTHPTNIPGMLGTGRVDAQAAMECVSPSCSNPIVVITPSSLKLCPSSTVTLTANSALSYTWSTGAHTQSINVTTAGNYTCTVTYSGTCTATGTYNLQSAPTTATITIPENSGNTANDGVFCGFNWVSMYCTPGSSYSWTYGYNTQSIVLGYSPPMTDVITVTVTNVGGCTGVNSTASATLQILSLPTLTVVATPTPTCSFQLSASGASTYTWSPGTALSCTACATTISTPTTATIYTVSGKDGNGCVNTSTVNVIGSPTVTVSGNTTICAGGSTTLTASGATTYSWNTGPTTASITVSPTVTTTYSVTGTTGSCINMKPVTVIVNPLPTLTISPTTPTLCYGSSVTFTATGASTYTWTPNTALSCSVCASPIASPTATTTYSVTGTNTTTTCAKTFTTSVTILSNNCTGTVVASPTVTSTYTISPAFINSNITVPSGVNWTLSSTDVRIAPGKSITVATNGTLTISGSYLHSCASCSSAMWQGIIVNPKGKVTTTNYSIIEDAVQAVYTATCAATNSVTTWNIDKTVFNKNGTDIYVDLHSSDLSGNYVYNNVFTCRTLPSYSLTSTNFSNIMTGVDACTPTSSGSYSTTTTLAGPRSTYALYTAATHTAAVNVGNSAQTNNIFDYHDYGVFSSNGVITVKNNIFQNHIGNDGGPNTIGVGVTVYGSGFETVPPKVIIGNANTTVNNAEKNTFTDNLRGVSITSCMNVYINNNSFSNATTASTFTAGTVTGQYGIVNTGFAVQSSSLSPGEGTLMCNNNIQNCATGLFFDFGKLYNTTGNSEYIYNNTISAVGTSTAYCNTGIFMQQSNTYGSGSGVPSNVMTVTSNSITNVAINAISLNSINTTSATTGFVVVDANTELSVKYTSVPTSTASPHVAAIYAANCPRMKITNNAKIQCTGLTTYSTSTEQYIAGVYMATSPSSTVNCNTVNCVGECFVWEGASAGSQWFKNKMQKALYGLVLRNSGVMGNQGSAGNPSGNIFGKYVNTDLSSAQTLADNSNPGGTGTSKLYGLASTCTATSTPTPCQNAFAGSGTSYSLTVTTFTTTGSLPCVCTGDCGSGRSAYTSADSAQMQRDSMLMELVYSIEYGDPLPLYDTETRWALQYYVSSQNSELDAASAYGNAKAFAIVDGAMGANNYSGAQAALNSITPNGTLENNWVTVDNITIKLQSNALDSADVAALNAVAIQCPLTGGNIVFNARALLNNYYGHIITYTDNCEDNNVSRTTTAKNIVEKTNAVLIYPNPNNGSMTIRYSINNNAVLEISDVSGKLVGKYNLSASSNSLNITNDRLENGVYFYRLSDGAENHTGKIVIMK